MPIPETPRPYPEQVVDAPPRPRTIAVIEDEASIASAVAARLRSEGYRVEIAGDGPAGVELCEKTRPDLVVLDLMLPGLDGLEVCRRIQRQRATPVLMLTARDSETDLVIGLGVGADDYMTKPFSARARREGRRDPAPVRPRRRRRRRADPRRRRRDRRRKPAGQVATASWCTSRRPSSTCSCTSPPPVAWRRARSCSSRCGATTCRRGAPSTRTSARCAASSARRSCAPCTVSDTRGQDTES